MLAREDTMCNLLRIRRGMCDDSFPREENLSGTPIASGSRFVRVGSSFSPLPAVSHLCMMINPEGVPQVDEDARKEIAGRHPNVLPRWLPAPYAYAHWAEYIMWDDGCDDVGNFLGFCPMHDADKKTEGSAEFNFHKGIIRCQGDPCCHAPKRAMSLVNVLARLQNVTSG